MRSRPGTLALAVAIAALWAAACSSPPPPPPEASQKPATSYVIGAGDQLGVRVWKNPELSVDVPVRPDGMITVPLLSDVHAEGMTPEELSQLVTKELSEFIANPDVTIVVLQTGSKRAYVIGAVVRPGPVPLATNLRVVDAIAMAGGFGPFANRKHVRIIRHDMDSNEVTYGFDYDRYVAGKAPGTNIPLLPGDTIVVPD